MGDSIIASIVHLLQLRTIDLLITDDLFSWKPESVLAEHITYDLTIFIRFYFKDFPYMKLNSLLISIFHMP